MRVLGLSGGIATGKSTVARLLMSGASQRGWRLTHLDADQIARDVVAPGSDGLRAVLAHFGAEFAHPDGHPDAGALHRAKLGALVFAQPEQRAALEALLHPRIRQHIAAQIDAARDAGQDLVLLDAALLLEMGLQRHCDAVLVVWCQPAVQLERMAARDGLNTEAAQQRLASQWSHTQRLAHADLSLDTDRALADMPAAVASLLDELHTRWPELA